MKDRVRRIRPFLVIASVVTLFNAPVVLHVSPVCAEARSHYERPAITVCDVTLLNDSIYFPHLIKAIDNAKREIVMSFFLFKTNGYPGNYPDIVLAHLIQAAKRNVTVTVVLERGKAPASQVDRNNRETAGRMKKSGILVYFDSPRTTTHTKVIVIDRRYTMCGSHNLTTSALKYNHEVSVFVDSPVFAEKMLRYIDSLYK